MLLQILHGTFFGLSVAAPFGPVSLLCVQRSLVGRRYLGFVSGIGAATAHGAFSSIAIGGADIVASALLEWRTPVHLVSAAVLVVLGVRTLRRAPVEGAGSAGAHQTAYLSGLFLALSNPMTILPYLAIASAGTTQPMGPAGSAFLMVPGVMFGASCWYAALSGGASALRRGISGTIIRRLNICAGTAMILFGIIIGVR